jgi:seryl-tRNA synthetase
VEQHTIELERPLPDGLVGEFARRIFFVAGSIVDFRFVRDGEAVTAVVLTTDRPERTADLTRKLDLVLRNEVRPQLAREPKVIWRSQASRTTPTGTYERLVGDGIAWTVGEGQVALGEPVLGLMDTLDNELRRIVRRELGGREYRYPTLIATSTLQRCGYLLSFPQYVMFVTRLHSDIDLYLEFLDDIRGADRIDRQVLPRCNGVDYSLPPTMCYHTFHQFADGPVPAGNSVVTSRGKSFRHEEKYRRGLERLWDFTIREVVFFGTRDGVLGLRERLLWRVLRLVDELGLTGRCEVANDPFFGNLDSAYRSTSQRLLELKYELRLDVGGPETVAAGSVNFHERVFGDAFGLTDERGETLYTACAGFGLERFAYAVVCQYGIDPRHWPPPLRSGAQPRLDALPEIDR